MTNRHDKKVRIIMSTDFGATEPRKTIAVEMTDKGKIAFLEYENKLLRKWRAAGWITAVILLTLLILQAIPPKMI